MMSLRDCVEELHPWVELCTMPEEQLFVRRQAWLFVDEDEGAGLELSAVEEGLHIDEIYDVPGQQGLHVGTLIVAVDGVPVDEKTCGSKESQEARFTELLHHGARVSVVEQRTSSTLPSEPEDDCTRFRCPDCFLGFQAWVPCLHHLRVSGHAISSGFKGTKAQELRHLMEKCLQAVAMPPPQVIELTLHANEQHGIGAHLVPVSQGLRVETVLDTEGLQIVSHAKLQEGDVLAAVDRRALDHKACGSAAHQMIAFAEAVRHGAQATVLRFVQSSDACTSKQGKDLESGNSAGGAFLESFAASRQTPLLGEARTRSDAPQPHHDL